MLEHICLSVLHAELNKETFFVKNNRKITEREGTAGLN
jgi:hypothetical protein